MRTLAPRTVAVAIFALTGCSSFGLREGGSIARNTPAPAHSLSQGHARSATAPSDAFAKLDGARADWKQSIVAEQLQQGAYLEQKGRLRDAAACYERALQKDSRNVAAHHRLAIVSDLQGHYVEAEQHYLAALESDITNSDVLSDLGYSYLLQRRFHESEQALQEALQHQPSHQFALGHLGTLFGLQGDYPRAREYLTRAGGEVKAQQELAKLFPQGPTTTSAIATTAGPANPFEISQPPLTAAASSQPAPTNAAQFPNEATRKLAEQMAQERQRLMQPNAGQPPAVRSDVPMTSGMNNQVRDARTTGATSGVAAGALAEQRRQQALDYLKNGPTNPNDLNRIFSQLDAEATRQSQGSTSRPNDTSAIPSRSFDAARRDGGVRPLAQASGTTLPEPDGLPTRDTVTQIPTNPPHGGVAHIPTQIPEAPGNPFAGQGDPQSIEQARAIAAQMGLNAGSTSLPPVAAPDPTSRYQSAGTLAPNANSAAIAPRSESILMQPPAGSPTVRQSLATSAAQQPPPWNSQQTRNPSAGGNFAQSNQGPGAAAPPVGEPVTNPQLIPNANGATNSRLLPNADGSTRSNLLPNANVAPENVRPTSDPTRSPTDLMNQFQQQQQQILYLQQELDRMRQQGATYQMYQHSTGLPSSQTLPR